jgi:hypothetical protein
MPLVEVEIVGEDESMRGRVSAHALADALGQVLGSPAGRTWLRLRRLDSADYAENGVAGGESGGPVFVTVQHAQLPTGAALVAEVAAVTQVVALCVGRAPDRVHVNYATPGAGRLAFGGRLVE